MEERQGLSEWQTVHTGANQRRMAGAKQREIAMNINGVPAIFIVFMAIFMGLRPAEAAGWEANFRRCQIEKVFSPDDDNLTSRYGDTDKTLVAIDETEIAELEKGISILKKCHKFWSWVADRDLKGKKVRCYLPKDIR
jgi:hypothetical protein